MATKINSKTQNEKQKETLIDPKRVPYNDKFPNKPQTDWNLNELQEGSRVIDECHLAESGSDDIGVIQSDTVDNLVEEENLIENHSGSDTTGNETVEGSEVSTSNESRINTLSGSSSIRNIDRDVETYLSSKITENATVVKSGTMNQERAELKTSPEAPTVHVRDDACTTCGIVTPDLKTCSRCKKIRYCSRDCQRSDWKKHKKTCKAGEGDVDNLIQQLRVSGDLHTITIKPSSKITLGEAKVKAMKIFSGLRVIDKMSELDYSPSKGVFVVKVTGIHINIMKYGIGVTDTDGKRLAVLFRIPNDKTLPYFDKDVVTSGSYACVKGARLHPVQFHLFARDNVCVLVTDASTVRFLD